MFLEALVGTVGMVGIGSGIGALMFWKKNGNGKHLPPDPTVYRDSQIAGPLQVQWPPELAALLTHITERLETAIKRVEYPLVVKDVGRPEWVDVLHQDLANINDRMSESATLPVRLTAGLGLITDRLEALMQIPPPESPDFEPVVERLEALVASMPEPDQRPELEAELVRQLAELPQRVGRSVSDAVAEHKATPRNAAPPEKVKNNPPTPPKSGSRSLPRMDPNEQPATPSIPAPYVPGTVTVPAGQVWSLLYLIQKQLSPNCPGSSVEFSISTDDEVLVGGASLIGGPLSETNYAYKLTPGNSPRTYRATYPGGNTPVGELQVFATLGGTLHVEVQS